MKANMTSQLEHRDVLAQMLQTVSLSLNVKKGRRYKSSKKLFYDVILLWGGPRKAEFVAMNLAGPEIHSIFRWWHSESKSVKSGLSVENFQMVSSIYEAIKTDACSSSLAEDETAIVGAVQYLPEKDVTTCFCGEAGPHHQCSLNAEVVVGNGIEGYQNIVNAFATKKIATQACAVIINPLHPDLPKIPIIIHPTCNRFDAMFVQYQCTSSCQLYDAHLHNTLWPLMGHSSDGTLHWWSLMLTKALSRNGDCHQPVPCKDGFILIAQRIPLPDGNEHVLSWWTRILYTTTKSW